MRIWRNLAFPLCLLLAAPFPAEAQQEKQSSAKSVQLEGITVTATKEEEKIQDVPTSISAFSETQVDDSRMNFVKDLGLRVPNLSFYSGGTSVINFPTMRGVRSDPHNNISGVSLYVDDVPVTSNLGFVSDLYDIDRIEVLRGPQGTLYGRSSEGGVIKIVTRKPNNTPEGKATLEAGTSMMFHGKANLSGPIIQDRLFMDGAFNFYNRDGWVKNDYDDNWVDDKQNFSGRGKIRFTPTEDLDVTLTGSFIKFNEGTFSMYQYPGYDDRHVNTNHPGYNHSWIDEESLNIKYTLNENWTITAISARRLTDADYKIDYDFSTTNGYETWKYDKYLDLSQELRFNYKGDNGASLVLGGYFDSFERKIQYAYTSMGMNSKAWDLTTTYSAFGNFKYPLFGGLSVLGGLRVDAYNTNFENETYQNGKSWTTLSPKAGLEYEITKHNMLYATASRGYRAGGFNSYIPMDGQYTFDEESLWAYELGSKNTFFDNTLKANMALFLNDIQNAQVEQYIASSGTPMPFISNAGDTTALGAELELTWLPMDGLELFGSAGYIHLRYGDFTDSYGSHKGNSMPYVPDCTYNVGAQYRHKSGLFARAEVLGSSLVYLDSRNKHSIPAHATVNAKVGWEFDKLDVYLFGTNVFDTRYDAKGAFGGGYTVASEPGTYGVSLTYHFF